MEKSGKVRIMSHFSASLEPFVILYLVLHFSEVWKFGIVRQSMDNVTLSPQALTPCLSFLVAHFSEVWKCGIVRQSKDNVTLFLSHEPLILSFFT